MITTAVRVVNETAETERRMKIYCFPYAGGSASVFSKWKEIQGDWVEIVPVELPGRGVRFTEELCDRMDQLIDDLYSRLEQGFIEDDYMLFGHSMGSWIVYYLTHRIVQLGIRSPKHLFLSGKEAPHLNKGDSISYTMKDDEFAKKIYHLGGTPLEFLENEELRDVFIPILKNDYKLVQTCQYVEPAKPFACGITIFNGKEDELTEEDINEWSRYTSQEFQVHHFNGGHFFIHEYAQPILQTMISVAKKKERVKGLKKWADPNLAVHNYQISGKE
ncbi:thioesterase II family protein [Paenibacillus dendritiformis]|uniref:thioesterase II family protein n=1 Tax=Paenibacillus dendritiformis TaxID=130049 RepID=UPI0018CDC30C|nr:thioesterase [Paenibacillus dendritiformis]